MRKILTILLAALAALSIQPEAAGKGGKNAAEGKQDDRGYREIKNIPYTSAEETDVYRKERCLLDIYYPENQENGFTTLVWFHGGGLEGGEKGLVAQLRNKGFAVVNVNYRLYPKVKCPGYIDDAALAVAWVMEHIAEYGGDPARICIGGHSAGGYLSLMIALDKQYLAKYGADADSLLKVYPVSGQTNTHYTIKKERGLPMDIPLVDGLAPLNVARKGGAPIDLITGSRDLELLARYEENAHLEVILRHLGHPVRLFEMEGFDHGSVLAPACLFIAGDIRRIDSGKAQGR